MWRKYLLAPAILSLACLLTLTDFAQAQRRGGGGGNRSWNGSYYNNGYRGGYYNGNNYYRNGWYGNFGVYISPSYGYRYGSPYRYYDFNYYTPTYNSTPYTDYVQPVAPTVAYSDTAQVRVIVPNPAARVWFDDRLTSQQGTDRMFTTPSLTSSGTYRIRASWMQGGNEVSAERTVTVAAGQSVMVDFTRQ